MNAQKVFEALYAVESIDGLEPEEALDYLGHLIDISLDVGRLDGTEKAIQFGDALLRRALSSPQASLLHYFLANAWANKGIFTRTSAEERWAWEQPESEKQIVHLRRAIQEERFKQLPPDQQAQVFTNLANLFSEVGRFIEAQECWNAALALIPQFAMALGNRGRGREWYARAVYDDGHRLAFFRHALVDFDHALAVPHGDPHGTHAEARKSFKSHRDWIKKRLPKSEIDKGTRLKEFSLGETTEEIRYRKWCLAHRLFLNPLNDLVNHSIAAQDILSTPSMIVPAGEGPHYQGFYNQMKQEFVSARWFYYEGITARKPHFSDKKVALYNTLDYPCYSLAVEKVKVGFRIAYSLLDKIAFFLNHYLGLGIPEKRVYFRTFWYTKQDRQQGLRSEFAKA